MVIGKHWDTFLSRVLYLSVADALRCVGVLVASPAACGCTEMYMS